MITRLPNFSVCQLKLTRHTQKDSKMAAAHSFVLCFLTLSALCHGVTYKPTWESIDSRPLPSWYDEGKLGIFIHWGVFSVPSFTSEWFWYRWKGVPPNAKVVEFMKKNYPPDFTYADFAADFTAEFYDPDEWAEIFEASGAKYVVFVSKHHEGFTNWPSKYSFNWNSMDVGPHRDIVGELADAVRKNNKLRFGLYHSLFEWFNPLYLQDHANNFTTQDYVVRKTMAELYEIVNKYKPEVIWSDGDGHAPDTYWNATHFLAWLYNDSPVRDTVVTNDRWGNGISCHHGGFFTCRDRYNPGTKQNHKFENAMTLDKRSWGFRREAALGDYLTMDEFVQTLIVTVSCGGNLLVNVGPTKYGTIVPIFEERLRDMGQWLQVNGEGIYASQPWSYQNDTLNSDVWYTMKDSGASKDVYAFVLKWPTDGTLTLGAPTPGSTTVVTLLGYTGSFDYSATGARGMTIKVPTIGFDSMPCQWAWTFKLTSIAN
ncbi:alpha-L-fucosidase-like isoform X1 [Littorina saxatilis]|uniref:alpha-L-fucosidase-like isoform X1 n=1 Tax=Littorina saxatilis TaxID=31220 RepID=UPI0038B5E6E1